MKRTPDERELEIAAFRYRILAEAAESESEGIVDALRRAAQQTYKDPHGRDVRFCLRTLWRWLNQHRRGGIVALCPKRRKDSGQPRRLTSEVLTRAQRLRREQPDRSTKTIIDILEREKTVEKGHVARSTLDRHLDRLGASRRRLHRLGQKTFRRIETQAPFELVVCDFHHGPYVHVGSSGSYRRALLCAFIDHFSRFVPEGRYYLHEDFAALRFGFRRLLTAFGLPVKLYVDNGPSYQATRFHAACDALDIRLIHSKPYQSEGRGVVERFNRTLKEQFESEVRLRDEALSLDELNAFFEAWLAERYHRDIHSEIREAPRERFRRCAQLSPAPDLAQVDELLRLRQRRSVHKKWSTVEIDAIRYSVNPALRGRRVDVLYDPFDQEYVLVVFDGRILQRAFTQKPGEVPADIASPQTTGPTTDYLTLLRADFEKRAQTELASLRLRPRAPTAELALADLVADLQRCRASLLSNNERSKVAALWRKLRPIDPKAARTALEAAQRQLGCGLHLHIYLDALSSYLIRHRLKGEKIHEPPKTLRPRSASFPKGCR